ncbi:hypothetical protein ACHAPJ_009932 [Fusarium lateritium]
MELSMPIQDVDILSTFWEPIQRRSRQKTIPAIIEAQKSWDHWACLTWKEGHDPQPHQFWDSDLYKILEATCYFLIKYPDDSSMIEAVEDIVSMIQNAQHEDGYINSYYTVKGLKDRWTNLRDNHELYCIGHLLEAAVAYETLTHNGKLLKVAERVCNHLDSVFGPDKKRGYPGHQEIEIGLLRLYEYMKTPLYLKLARFFILERGQRDEKDEIYFDKEAFARGGDPYDFMGSESKLWFHEPRDYGYQQADQPLVDATEVKGHAVRAMYFYAAATDLARICPNDEMSERLDTALARLWRDLVDGKIYVTGSIGSVTQNEGFGRPYSLLDLEHQGCYNETCACFALINWCQRMLWRELDSEYSDIMETALYNGFLGAISQDGDAFYYQNVLRTRNGEPKSRCKWFGVACCPPNVAKLLGNLGALIYSYQPSGVVAVHQYIGSVLRTQNGAIIRQKTNMPWDGRVSFAIQGKADLALRIPHWAKDWTSSVSGELTKGYLYLYALEDTEVELDFKIVPTKVYAHPKTNKDEVCISRGPLVYCLEDVDNPGCDIDHVALPDDALVYDGDHINIGSQNKVVTLRVEGREVKQTGRQGLYGRIPWVYEKLECDLVAIPYFLRENRGKGRGAMRVWTPRLSKNF